MMPAMAAAYATLEGPEVPRATSALNVLQRVGGSIGHGAAGGRPAGPDQGPALGRGQVGQRRPAASGTLERLPEDLRARVAEPLAAAFASTFWWAVGMSVLALVPAAVLALTQRRARRDDAAAEPFLEPEKLPA